MMNLENHSMSMKTICNATLKRTAKTATVVSEREKKLVSFFASLSAVSNPLRMEDNRFNIFTEKKKECIRLPRKSNTQSSCDSHH